MQPLGDPPDSHRVNSKQSDGAQQQDEVGSIGSHLINLVNAVNYFSEASGESRQQLGVATPLSASRIQSLAPELPAATSPTPSRIANSPAESIQRLANASSLNEISPNTRLDFFLPLFVLLVSINLAVILGNILVILAVNASAKLRNVTNIFIVSLATADLLLGLFVMPYALVYQVLDVWVFGELWCRGWLVTDVWISTASILNLCAISIDRYVAVTRPVKYRSIMTNRRAKCIVAIVWILAFIICLPPLLTELNPSSGSGGGGQGENGLPHESASLDLFRAPELASAKGVNSHQIETVPAGPRHRRSSAGKSRPATIFVSPPVGDIAATNDRPAVMTPASLAGRGEPNKQICDHQARGPARGRASERRRQRATASVGLDNSAAWRRFETSAKSKRLAPAGEVGEDELYGRPLQGAAMDRTRQRRHSFMGPSGGVTKTTGDETDEHERAPPESVPDDVTTPKTTATTTTTTTTWAGPEEIKLPFGLSIVLNEAERAPDDRSDPKGQDAMARAHKSSSSSPPPSTTSRPHCLEPALECYRWHRRHSNAQTHAPAARCQRMRPEPLQAREAGRAARSLSYEHDDYSAGLRRASQRNPSVIDDKRRPDGSEGDSCGPLLAATRVSSGRGAESIFLLWPASDQLNLANCGESARRRCWPMISECLHRLAGQDHDHNHGRGELNIGPLFGVAPTPGDNKVRSAGSQPVGPAHDEVTELGTSRDFISNRKLDSRPARPVGMIAVEAEAAALNDRAAAGQIRLGLASDFGRWLEAAGELELVRVRFGVGQWRCISFRPRELLQLAAAASSTTTTATTTTASLETGPSTSQNEVGTRATSASENPIRQAAARPNLDCGPMELLLHLLNLAGRRDSKGANSKGRHPRRWIDNGIRADETHNDGLGHSRRGSRDVKMGAAHTPEARSSLAGSGGHSRANDPPGTMAATRDSHRDAYAAPKSNNDQGKLESEWRAGEQPRQHQQLAHDAADRNDDCRNINDYPAPSPVDPNGRLRGCGGTLSRPFGEAPPAQRLTPATGAVKLKQEAGSGVNRTASALGEPPLGSTAVTAAKMRPRWRIEPEVGLPLARRGRRSVEPDDEREGPDFEAPLRRERDEKLNCALFHQKTYVVYSALGSFFIPMLVMVFFYSRIYLVASRAQKAMQRGYMTTKWPPMATSMRAGKQTQTNTTNWPNRNKTGTGSGSVRQSKRSFRGAESGTGQSRDGTEKSGAARQLPGENSASCGQTDGGGNDDGVGCQCRSESDWISSGSAAAALSSAQMDQPGRVTLRIHRRTEPPPSPLSPSPPPPTQQANPVQSAGFKALALRSSALIARGRESQSLRGAASRLLRTLSSDTQPANETQPERGGNKSKLMQLIALEQQLSMRRATGQRRTRLSLDRALGQANNLDSAGSKLSAASNGSAREGRKRSSLPPEIRITQFETEQVVAIKPSIDQIQEVVTTSVSKEVPNDEVQEAVRPEECRQQADEAEKQHRHHAHRHKRRSHRHNSAKSTRRKCETREASFNDATVKITIDTSADEPAEGVELPEVLQANDDDYDEGQTESHSTRRADRSQSQAMPSIVVNWYPEAAEKLQASMPTLTLLPASSSPNEVELALDSNDVRRTQQQLETTSCKIYQSQSSGSGLSLVQAIPQQVRKQSMLLLSSITSRSGQTLRRLSMVAAHPVDSLLTRSTRGGDSARCDQRRRRRSRRSSSSAISYLSNSSCRSSSLSESSSGVATGAISREPDEADRMLDKANSMSTSGTETGAGHLFGARKHKRGRKRPKSAAGLRSKKTLDDYLMAVAGIDNSSDEQDDDDEDYEGCYNENEDQSDSSESSSSSSCASNLTSMLKRENLLIPTIAIVSADNVGGESQEQAAELEPGGGQRECDSNQANENQHESDRERQQQMARQEQQLARLDKDVKRAEHLPPSAGLHRQGGLYESATSRRQSQASSSGEPASPVERRQEAAADVRAHPSRSPDLFRLLDPKMRRARALADADNRTGAWQTQRQQQAAVTGGGSGTSSRRRGLKRTSRWHAKRLRAETKAAKTVAIIVGGFIFCWLPFFTAYLSRAIICSTPSCIPQTWLSLSIWLGYINSAINPVIYGLFSADFRHAFKSIVCRCSLRAHSQALQHDPNRNQHHHHTYLNNTDNHYRSQRPMAATAAHREGAVLSTLADGILKSFL